MNLLAFFKLIRWKNLLLVLYVQLILKFIAFPSFNIETFLTPFQFVVLVISILSITAAGYIINDISDIKTDLINKPAKVIVTKDFSIEKSKRFYLWLNSIGIMLGIGLSLNVEKPSYSFIFIGASLLLYYYSKIFKSKPLIGNLIVSFLIAFNIFVLYLFDIYTVNSSYIQLYIFYIISILCLFAFLLNLIREIIKDIIDVNGDNIIKMNTLPILIGQNRAKKAAIFLCVIPLILLVYIVYNFTSIFKITIIYLIPTTILPILFVLLKLNSAKTKNEFQKLSSLLKLIMLLGISAIIIFSFNQYQ